MTENKSQIDIDIIDPIIENDLQGYELDEGEYAPKTVSRIEALIYTWAQDYFCVDEAMRPAWNIKVLAQELHNTLLKENAEIYPVIYQSGKENSDEK